MQKIWLFLIPTDTDKLQNRPYKWEPSKESRFFFFFSNESRTSQVTSGSQKWSLSDKWPPPPSHFPSGCKSTARIFSKGINWLFVFIEWSQMKVGKGRRSPVTSLFANLTSIICQTLTLNHPIRLPFPFPQIVFLNPTTSIV